MKKAILILMFFTFSLLNSAEQCKIRKNPSRSDVHAAQQCLKREIEKSIELGREYLKHSKEVETALKDYYEDYDSCVEIHISYLESSTEIRKKQFNKCLAQLSKSKKEVRRLERQNGLLNDTYKVFKESIEDLKNALENLKMEYRKLLRDGR